MPVLASQQRPTQLEKRDENFDRLLSECLSSLRLRRFGRVGAGNRGRARVGRVYVNIAP